MRVRIIALGEKLKLLPKLNPQKDSYGVQVYSACGSVVFSFTSILSKYCRPIEVVLWVKVRRNTSIRVDRDLWRQFKVWCVQNDKVMSEVLEDCILRVIVEGDEALKEFLGQYAEELRKEK